MFDIGFQEMLVIGVIALLVFGPSKLPELGRMVGRALREFRRASDEFRQTVETNLHMNDLDPVIAPSPSHDVETPPASVPYGSEVTVAPESTVPADDGAGETPAEPYCARRESRLFHRSQCQWVTRIPEAQRLYFKTLAEAREQGFVTCPVCEPWEPA